LCRETIDEYRKTPYTVKRPILKSSLMRQIAPLEYISTLLKRPIPKKPRYPIYELSRVMRNFMVNLKLLFLFVLVSPRADLKIINS
jgi:hypothetical protein